MSTGNSPFDNAHPVPAQDVPAQSPLMPALQRGFASRTVSLFFRISFILLILGFLLGAYIFMRYPRMQPAPPSTAAAGVALPSVSAKEEKTEVDYISNPLSQLAKMFTSVAGSSGASGGISAQMQINAAKDKAAKSIAESVNPQNSDQEESAIISTPIAIPGTINNVIDNPVIDENGKRVGAVYDILVDRRTGNSTNIIINYADGYRGLALTAIHFNEVAGKDQDGTIEITTDAATIGKSPRFTYDQVPAGSYISLRGLQGGQVLDDRGQTAGKIDGINYRNGSAQNIVFTMASPDSTHKPASFVLPYKSVKIVTASGNRHYIQLNRAQMEVVAKTILPVNH